MLRPLTFSLAQILIRYVGTIKTNFNFPTNNIRVSIFSAILMILYGIVQLHWYRGSFALYTTRFSDKALSALLVRLAI